MRPVHAMPRPSQSETTGSTIRDDDVDRPSGEYRLDSRTRARHYLRHACVADVMSERLHAVAPDWRVADVRELARSASSPHFVVVPAACLHGSRDGTHIARYDLARSALLGMLGHHDLADAHAEARVEEIMSRPVAVAGIAVSLEHAAYVMRSRGVGALPIVDEGRVAGIVTRDDLRRGGVPDEDLERQCCTACGGRRQLEIDYRARGITLCGDCAERSTDPIPDCETGVGD